MKWISAICILTCGLTILTGCSSTPTNGTQAGEKKPYLEATVTVNGTTAAIAIKTDLIISKEHYNQERVPGEGHIHMSVDNGENIIVTEDHTELTDLSQGPHNVKLSLHNNDHTPYDVSQSIDFEVK
ncbi:hypothetical protein B5M42_001700 [Paenibacillus athensensis]|uniref:DUF4399 domain-containing protein n=1 Tax=Paenibacillus athensensis TaxID=1967502 RepID=A0A4Y8QAJ2_9BACL|nr:hypothetical protein [Paenibacillus athensensis]MCD1257550.1 hypothetical protein [Paenibacillus athensensis]